MGSVQSFDEVDAQFVPDADIAVRRNSRRSGKLRWTVGGEALQKNQLTVSAIGQA
jgi:hypothetical protein